MSTTLELIQNELTKNEFAKRCLYGIGCAAVMGAAFYVGYQAASKRHKRHYVRDTEKNDQVRIELLLHALYT
jgi:hypothetical protein